MHQGIRVDELDRCSSAEDAVIDGMSHGRCGGQDQQGAQSLTAAVNDVVRDLVDQGDIAAETLKYQTINAAPVIGDQVSDRLQGGRMEWCIYQLHRGA